MNKNEKPDAQPKKKGGIFSWMYDEVPVEESAKTEPKAENSDTSDEPDVSSQGDLSIPVTCDPKDVEKLFAICVPDDSVLAKFIKVFDSLSEFIPDQSKLIQAVFKANPAIDGPGLIAEIENTHLSKLEAEKQNVETDLNEILRRDTSSKEKQIRELEKEISDAKNFIIQKQKEISDLEISNEKRIQDQSKLSTEIASKKQEMKNKTTHFYLAYEAVKGRFEQIKKLLKN